MPSHCHLNCRLVFFFDPDNEPEPSSPPSKRPRYPAAATETHTSQPYRSLPPDALSIGKPWIWPLFAKLWDRSMKEGSVYRLFARLWTNCGIPVNGPTTESNTRRTTSKTRPLPLCRPATLHLRSTTLSAPNKRLRLTAPPPPPKSSSHARSRGRARSGKSTIDLQDLAELENDG